MYINTLLRVFGIKNNFLHFSVEKHNNKVVRSVILFRPPRPQMVPGPFQSTFLFSNPSLSTQCCFTCKFLWRQYITVVVWKLLLLLLLLATRQTDVSTSAIQIPTTPPPPPIIPNRREIRDWLIVDRQIGSFYEVRLARRTIDWKLLYMCQSA